VVRTFSSLSPTEGNDGVQAASQDWVESQPLVNSDALATLDPDPSMLSWGPVDSCTFAIDWIHNATGYPWWVSIIGVTAMFRLALLPAAIFQMRAGLRLKEMQPHLKEVQEKMKANPPQTPAEQQKYVMQMQNLQQKYGVKIWHPLLMPLAQIPIFLTMFWTLRNMAQDYPSMQTGGTLWFENLSVPDPTYGLPIICASSFVLLVEIGTGETPQGDEVAQQRMKFVMRALGLAMIPITMTMPSSLALYWTTSNVFSITQTLFFKISGTKELLGIRSNVAASSTSQVTVEQDDDNTISGQKVFFSKRKLRRKARKKTQ